jgi:hypothetical protein
MSLMMTASSLEIGGGCVLDGGCGSDCGHDCGCDCARDHDHDFGWGCGCSCGGDCSCGHGCSSDYYGGYACCGQGGLHVASYDGAAFDRDRAKASATGSASDAGDVDDARNAAAIAVKMNGVMFSSRIRSQSSQVAIPIGARGSLHEFASTLQTMALTSSPSTVRIAVKCSPLFTTWPRTVLRAAHEFHFGSNLTVLTLVRDKGLSHMHSRLLVMRDETSDSVGSCPTDSARTDFHARD